MIYGNAIFASTVKQRTDYVTFSSPNNFTVTISDNTKHWNGELQYSTDAETWEVWSGTSALSSAGGKLYMRGTGNTVITGNGPRFAMTGNAISCDGNIETLLDYQTVANGWHPIMTDWCFGRLFMNCPIVKSPDLPALTLSESCYNRMFWGCPITEPPALPATTLARDCYNCMLYGCESLTTPPILPATTLAIGCYYYMCYGCTGLTTPSKIPAIVLPRECCRGMFGGCTWMELYQSSDEYHSRAYRIPHSGQGTDEGNALYGMFDDTGGDFVGTPSINTTYYIEGD